MRNYDILIVEDDINDAKEIENSLLRIGYSSITIIESCEKALEHIINYRPDIVLMDVIFNRELKGIDFANIFLQQYQIPVVFISHQNDNTTLDKAKLAEPYAYIFFPYKEKELEAAIEITIYKHDKNTQLLREKNLFYSISERNKVNKDSIFVRANFRLNRIKFKDLYYVEALKDYVNIHTKDNVFTTHATMKEMANILPPEDFVRTHRSYIVRLDKIFSIKYPELVIEGKMKVLPIGGLYHKDLFSRLDLI